jgi:hypothetical protein
VLIGRVTVGDPARVFFHLPPTAANTATSIAWSIFRFGWRFDVAGLQWRHRADRVLRRALDACHDPPLERRSVRLLAPMQ